MRLFPQLRTVMPVVHRRYRRVLGGVLLALGLLGSVTAGMAQASNSPAVAPQPNHAVVAVIPYYQLIAQHSGKCADLKYTYQAPSTNNGTNVRQWACKPGYSLQQWRFVSLGNGYYHVINRVSGRCMDVESGLRYNGTNVHQWTCSSTAANQQWWLRALGSGVYELRPRSNIGQCLDVEDVSRNDGADIYQWVCTVGAQNQRWRLHLVA